MTLTMIPVWRRFGCRTGTCGRWSSTSGRAASSGKSGSFSGSYAWSYARAGRGFVLRSGSGSYQGNGR